MNRIRSINDIPNAKDVRSPLEKWRASKGLSLRQAANLAGVSYSAMYRVEQRKKVSLKNIIALSKWYGFKEVDLMQWLISSAWALPKIASEGK